MIENFNGNVYRLIPQPAKFIVVYVATVIRKEFRHARIKISRRYNFGPECSTACQSRGEPCGRHNTGVVIFSLLCHSLTHSSNPAKEGMNAPHSSLSFSGQYLGKKKTAGVHSSTPNTACIHSSIITKLETTGAPSSPSFSCHLYSKFELWTPALCSACMVLLSCRDKPYNAVLPRGHIAQISDKFQIFHYHTDEPVPITQFLSAKFDILSLLKNLKIINGDDQNDHNLSQPS